MRWPLCFHDDILVKSKWHPPPPSVCLLVAMMVRLEAILIIRCLARRSVSSSHQWVSIFEL